MSFLSWLSILNIFVLLASVYLINSPLNKKKSAFSLLITGCLFTYLISNIIYLFDNNLISILRFLNITTLVCALSALFNLIRESKPIFARFPAILSFLPFTLLFFVPLILDQLVIYNLIIGTFQGGCIIVALLIFTLSQFSGKNYKWHILGTCTALSSFLVFWLSALPEKILISEVLLAIGILFLSKGIKETKLN